MPELPDVETFKRRLDATSLGKSIRDVNISCPRLLTDISKAALVSHLRNRRFTKSRRHGKYLLVAVSGGGWLALHFGMSGALTYSDSGTPPYACLRLGFGGERALVYTSRRKLGRVSWVSGIDELVRRQKLGPDALSLTAAGFRNLLRGRRGQVKSTLMNQSVIAGIGNIYSDEILFQAGLMPRRSTQDLDGPAIEKLFHAMRKVLNSAIRHKADPDKLPKSFLLPHRRKGGFCPSCGSGLRTVKAAGRTSYYCPTDQQ